MGKVQQIQKIKQIGEALVAAGVSNLDDQASTLGLCRSTTWSLLKAGHKHSGLSASVVKTILTSPRLPNDVRSKVLEYVEEKISGQYGHAPQQISRFTARLGPLSATFQQHRTFHGFDCQTEQREQAARASAIKPPHTRAQFLPNVLAVGAAADHPRINDNDTLSSFPRARAKRT